MGNAHSSGPRSEEPGDDGQVLGVQEDQGQEHSASVSGGASGAMVNAESQQDDQRKAGNLAEEKGCGSQSIKTAGDAGGERSVVSELGGAIDGPRARVDATANRVDRLRLIGNGVVVPTAEIALRTLLRELDG